MSMSKMMPEHVRLQLDEAASAVEWGNELRLLIPSTLDLTDNEIDNALAPYTPWNMKIGKGRMSYNYVRGYQ